MRKNSKETKDQKRIKELEKSLGLMTDLAFCDGSWFRTPYLFFGLPGISHQEASFLAYILNHIFKCTQSLNCWAFLRQSTVEKELFMSKQRQHNAIRALIDHGYIETRKGKTIPPRREIRVKLSNLTKKLTVLWEKQNGM